MSKQRILACAHQTLNRACWSPLAVSRQLLVLIVQSFVPEGTTVGRVYTRPYTPEGERPRWNVWGVTAGTGRRIEVEPWALGVLALQRRLR